MSRPLMMTRVGPSPPLTLTFFFYLLLTLYVTNCNSGSSSTHWKLIVDDGGQSIIVPSDDPAAIVGSQQPQQRLDSSGDSKLPSSHQKQRSFRSGSGSHDHHNGNSSEFLNWRSRGGLGPNSAAAAAALEAECELVMSILTTTVITSKGSWTKTGAETSCYPNYKCPVGHDGRPIVSGTDSSSSSSETTTEVLDCGRTANYTYYDQLIGIANRANHPQVPEPSVALLFRKKNSKKDTVDLATLERKLRKAKKEKPGSVQLYNQIGNFWRIKGNTLRSIECFRRALAVAPNNPEVLHNLARLLLTLQYLDDALFLARRSLELQAPDRSAWQQHFTLGEILKAYGHHQEALLHFKHTLELRPDHEGAIEALRDLETLLSGTGLHICTLLIIIFLVIGVLLVMLSSIDGDDGVELTARPTSRHFSRALAMRSLKLGISSPRALRAKRLT